MAKTAIKPSKAVTVSINPASIAANQSLNASVTVAGSQPTNHFNIIPKEALTAGLVLGTPYCLTAGTVLVPFTNHTGSAIDETAKNYEILIF